mgnify:CR=1 FL=1
MIITLLCFLIDAITAMYLVAIGNRYVWNYTILGQDISPLTFSEAMTYAGIGIVSALAASISGISFGKRLMRRPFHPPHLRRHTDHIIWLLLLTSTIAAWVISKVSLFDLLSTDGLTGAARIFADIMSPLTVLFQPITLPITGHVFDGTIWLENIRTHWAIFPDALSAIIETIYFAFLATALALPPSFILAFAAAHNVMRNYTITRSIYSIVRLFANFSRSIEPLIWAIIFSVWVGIGPFAGMLALFIHTISSLVKQYSEQIETINHGPVEAIEATGAHPLQVIWFAMVPQIVIPFLSFTIYRWDINVRMATIIGMVGGGGIGTLLMQSQGLARWQEVGVMVLMIAFVVWIMDIVSGKLRQALA